MDIKLELMAKSLADMVKDHMEEFGINAEKIAETRANLILGEIQLILTNERFNDYDVVDAIVRLFKMNMLDTGNRHLI